MLARDKRELEAPSSIDEKRTLEEGVQRWERWIQRYKEALERNERALSLERQALLELLSPTTGKWLIISFN